MKKIRYIPYGYTMQNGQIIVDEDEADVIRSIYDNYVAGASLKAIAEQLTLRRVPYTEKTTVWDKARVARILQNAKYTGSDDYAPIVDDELYDRAVALKTARQRNTFEKNREGIDLLRSCTRCAACGAPMHRRVNAKLRIRESWECTNPGCGIRVRISDAHLLEIIVSLMNRLIENDTLLLPKKKRRITSDQARAISQEVMERLAQGPVDESYIIERAKEYARQLYDDGDTTTALSVALARKRMSVMQPQSSFRPDYFIDLIDHITIGQGGIVRLITKTDACVGEDEYDSNENQ